MKEEENIIIRIVLSAVLCFLPSFLIFSIFNQYGFSLLKYVEFLLNISVSLGSWISIIAIFLVVYFSMSKIKSKKKRIIVLVLITCFILAYVIFYLYANFLLGNDVLVKLSVDKENLFFDDNSTQSLKFTMSALVNPFCIAQCQYSFIDLSTSEEIESGEFSLASVLPRTQEYVFTREGHVQGQALNRFEIKCQSKKTILCYTRGEESERAILITLNYNITPEQQATNEISKNEIISLEKIIHNQSQNLGYANSDINMLNYIANVEEPFSQFDKLSNTFSDLNSSFEELKQSWLSQNYPLFEQEFPSLKEKINNLGIEEDKFRLLVGSNISKYNELVQSLNESRNVLKKISLENLSEESCTDLNEIRTRFNETMKEFKKKANLSYKEIIVNKISLDVTRAYEFPNENNNLLCSLSTSLNEENLNEIEIINYNQTIPEFYLENPSPLCCLYGKCEKCCDEDCTNKNYPIIFLHGHSFNKNTPADYSLDGFQKIKGNLTEERYIDAGKVVLGQTEKNGLWGRANAPIEITASYFFDIYKSEEGETIITSKTESIDTYSIRLKEIINTVKERTNKEKVIIVAHSMGGLVTRRYVQVFGEKDIAEIIFITVPNHGIEGNIENYCSLIGSEMECKDMSKDSLLINRLNNAQNMSIILNNIIGTGCDMNGEKGDGVVTESSQYLTYAKNYYVNGTCNQLGLEFLHEKILDPENYPQAYELIKKILKEDGI